jgi:hypothetical protein
MVTDSIWQEADGQFEVVQSIGKPQPVAHQLEDGLSKDGRSCNTNLTINKVLAEDRAIFANI